MQETFDTGYKLEDRSARWIEGYVFLKPGVTRQQAGAELHAISQRLEKDYPETNRGREPLAIAIVENAVQSGAET